MRILVNALPRTGSKWLCVNLRKYLRTKYGSSARLSVGDQIWPITDWFSNINNKLLINGHIDPYNNNFILNGSYTNIETEIANRLKLLKECKNSIAIKIHPNTWIETIAIEAIKPHCQHYYTLRRKNVIDEAFSLLVCQHTDIWEPSDKLNETILSSCKTPFSIEMNTLLSCLDSIKQQHLYLDSQENAHHLLAEDLFKIKNAKRFCKYLALPYVEFEIDQYFGVEYGNKKVKMIKNYKKLLQAAKEHIS